MFIVDPSMLSPGSSRPPISRENRSDWLLTTKLAPVPSPASETVPLNGPLNSAGRLSTDDQTLKEGISTVPDSRPVLGDRKSATFPVSSRVMTSLMSRKVETSTCLPSRDVFRSIFKRRLWPIRLPTQCAEVREVRPGRDQIKLC